MIKSLTVFFLIFEYGESALHIGNHRSTCNQSNIMILLLIQNNLYLIEVFSLFHRKKQVKKNIFTNQINKYAKNM